MLADDERLLILAGAVVDGAPVDWAKERASTPDPEVRQVVEQLQVLDHHGRCLPLGRCQHRHP